MTEPRRRRDPYEVLGVARDADAETIRKAYRRLARQHHPDVNPGDSEAESRFKEISEAWAILSDSEKRRDYDEFGDVAREAGFDAAAARRAREAFGARFGAGTGAADAFGAEGGPSEFHFDLDDLMERAFPGGGGRRGARGRRRGHDLETTLELDFQGAVRGGEHRLELARPGENGPARETVTVRIPAGVADGGRIRIPGKGMPGAQGGPPGDLWATIRVRPHPVFRREGRDLLIEVPVSVGEATLGAKIEIPTLEGRAILTIPPGTDSGRRLRLRGKGVPDPSGGERGDLHALVQIRVPRDLDESARKALESLDPFTRADLRKDLFR